ncbi:NUDIX domain-containing protein [Shinella curvata]|uniref:NUDIX domain-containing protein n=1 Tax=Shinella curvata TaxID=1817964 RepID=A0ABT8XJ29_9HYPH|nr:NUDIX domain-containing protein [Shinella curvata]MCJ8052667.1 NUDIX domain-containing protein [Shinella curvata]MDO6123747.1 NUDIX domain-containing protein [Shinella curvata]
MEQDRPQPASPPTRSVLARLLTGLVHQYFALSRGMTMGVRAACFDDAGRVFLVRHSYVPGWHLPGGGIERGETALEAVAKEIREEGNLALGAPPRLLHVYFNKQTSRRDHVLLYRCDGVTQTAPRLKDREIVEAGFFTLDALPAATTAATRRRLEEIAGRATFADFW